VSRHLNCRVTLKKYWSNGNRMMFKHRTFIFILSLLLISVPLVVSADGQRGIVPVPIKDRSGNQILLYQESHALLVGISEYTQGWPSLPGVRKDINEVKTALEQKGFHTVMVINPSRIELRDSIEDFINLYGQDIDNRLIFYFAGHGHTMKSSYGEEMGYFVPADAPNPNIDKSGFLATSLNMESIEVYSKQVQSKHALFLFDSCFSGSIFALSRAIPENISFKTSKPVRQFITAGSANETVPDESIFNDQLIRALNGEGDLDGDGYLTGVELGEYLNKTVINYSKGSQHPQYGKIRNPNLDKGDFVFSLLDTSAIENSIDVLASEREELKQERLEIKQKRMEAAKRLEGERVKLEEEREKLKVEREKLARLSPSFGREISRRSGKRARVMTRGTPLRVRAKPDSRSRVVANVPNSSVLTVYKETSDWFQIEHQTGKKGWITKKYSRLVEGKPISKDEILDGGSMGKRLLVMKEGVALKRGPGTIYPNITKLRQGEEVSFVRRTNIEFNNKNWLVVKYKSRSGYVWEGDVKWSEEKETLLDELQRISKLDANPIDILDHTLDGDEPVSLATTDVKYASYFARVKKQIERVWVYPTDAVKRGIIGDLTLSFRVSKDGNLLGVSLLDQSGYEILDMAALKAVKDAAPFYPFPSSINREKLLIQASFVYTPNKEPTQPIKTEDQTIQKQSLSGSGSYSDIVDHLGSLGSKYGIRKLEKP
jgi:TonB family protein